jgi:H+/Cl- antiporter ClcA
LFKKIILSILVGLLAGLSSSIFLYTLDFVTDLRLGHQGIIWFLPLAGFLIGYIYHCYGKDVSGGNNLIIDEIHDPKKTIPFIMGPFVFLGTILTHLFGGSAGREGTAVQMGASLADQVSSYFKLIPSERKSLLMSGTGAGFGAAIGAPFAGFFFGMEVVWTGRIRFKTMISCFISSFTAYYFSKILRAPHSVFPELVTHRLSFKELLFVAIAAIIFGLMTRLFILSTHWFEKVMSRTIKYPPFRPLLGGLVIAILFWFEGSYHYAGLGIGTIQAALIDQSPLIAPFLKSIFTTITLGSGFKGGEFVPLVFIGATLGSYLTSFLPLSVSLLSSVGFSSLFAAASKTPIACTIMSIEIFGWEITPYAFIGCMVATFVSGKKGIYLAKRL